MTKRLTSRRSQPPLALAGPLNFLGKKKWALRDFADDPKFSDFQAVVESASNVDAQTVLTLSHAPGGGFSGIIKKAD